MRPRDNEELYVIDMAVGQNLEGLLGDIRALLYGQV